MEFKKYTSIENTYRNSEINYIQSNALDRGEFIVEEKVHGAQFSFRYDGKEIKCARRTAFLEENENFYKWKTVLEEERPHIEALYEMLVDKYDNLYITIHGELFGGGYNHPNVEKYQGSKRVQGEIEYCPNNRFYAFDLMINDMYCINIEDVKVLFEKAGFFYAKTLFKGTFAEVLAYPNKFQTKIPEWLGLPPIENNICEGVVIKPNVNTFYANGSRLVLKNKNEKFTEKNKVKKTKVVVNLSEEGLSYLDIAMSYVTENRLRNVLSKIGEVTQQDFGKIKGLFTQDIMLDFEKENPEINIDDLGKAEKKKWQNEFGNHIASLIRKNFLNIIDGDF